jgi:hypothetical protein
VLRLLPGPGKRLGESIREVAHDQPAAVLTEVDPEANGCLTWRPGQQQPEAITPPESDGSAFCGCFIGFVRNKTQTQGRSSRTASYSCSPPHAHRRFMALIERGHHLRASAGVTPLARATADAARRSAVGRPWLRPGVDRGRVREPIDGCAYVPSGAGTLVGQRPRPGGVADRPTGWTNEG